MADGATGVVMLAVAKSVAAKAGGMLAGPAGRVVRKRLLGDPEEKALASALARAWERTEASHGLALRRHDVNSDVLRFEAADQLARVVVPGPRPDPFLLAEACVGSLAPGLGPEDRYERALELTPVFETFLSVLREEVGRETVLNLRAARVDEATVADGVDRLVRHAGAATGTVSDEARYLHWVADRNRYLNTVGMVKNTTVQVPLDEVFVTLAARRDPRPGDRPVRWVEDESRRLDSLLAAGEVDHLGREAALDRMSLHVEGGAGWSEAEARPVDVTDAVAGSSHVLVLGDPGSGKTTLLRYLALRHATALEAGGQGLPPGMGAARLPLLVRIGDFARSSRRDEGLGAFLTGHFRAQECRTPGLDDLIERRLASGTCLVLLDGLDEVASPQERRGVVDAITNFVTAHALAGNRFVVTSRVSGYLAAPLPGVFDTYRVQSMDDATVRRFLERYTPAVERFHAPDASQALVEAEARRATRELIDAFERNPGVRRLAANPLLLAALVLVHRATGRLPRRRIDAYVEVTDALTRSWREAQGVPGSDLPDDRLLTRWLTRLGGWMHEHRPEGSASRRELLEVLGPLWAENQGGTWDGHELEAADPLDTPAGRGVGEVVDQAELHTGLLVERAPGRFGFPHLTFEEYYAGRSLVSEGAAVDTPARIRRHLHDPRYEEPILLSLGLVGRDRPEQIDHLMEAAIHGTIEPSPQEALLGRDFLFALRVLADDVGVATTSADRLLAQAVADWFDEVGRGRFKRYHRELGERLRALAGSESMPRLARLVDEAVAEHAKSSPERLCGLAEVAALNGPLSDQMTTTLTGLAMTDGNPTVQVAAVQALARADKLTSPVINVFANVIRTVDELQLGTDALYAIWYAEPDEAVLSLLTEMAVGHRLPRIRAMAIRMLCDLDTVPDEVIASFVAGPDAASLAETIESIAIVELPEVLSDALTELACDHDREPEVRIAAICALQVGNALTKHVITEAKGLARAGRQNEAARIVYALAAATPNVSDDAEDALLDIANDHTIDEWAILGPALSIVENGTLVGSLLEIIRGIASRGISDEPPVAATLIYAKANPQQQDVDGELLDRLDSTENPYWRARVLECLAERGAVADSIQAELVHLAATTEEVLLYYVARGLVHFNPNRELEAIAVDIACQQRSFPGAPAREALTTWTRRSPEVAARLMDSLIRLQDPHLRDSARLHRPVHRDNAYEALWAVAEVAAPSAWPAGTPDERPM